MDEPWSEPFHLAQVQQAIAMGRLDVWLESYLSVYNVALLEGLRRVPRHWEGPLQVPLESLVRCCAPEPDMEFHVPLSAWNRRVGSMLARFTHVEQLPPLICQRRGGQLSLRDGNHRYEMLRRAGVASCWILIWSTPV